MLTFYWDSLYNASHSSSEMRCEMEKNENPSFAYDFNVQQLEKMQNFGLSIKSPSFRQIEMLDFQSIIQIHNNRLDKWKIQVFR